MANELAPPNDRLATAAQSAPVDEASETAEERAIVRARWAEYGRTKVSVTHAEVMRKIAERRRTEGG